jgi:tRNA threonylcarbamoyladenosine biosynthesis protein TsaB
LPVSTLAALAQGFFNQSEATISFTALDARMGEIFWGVYEKNSTGFAELLGEEAVTPAESIIFPHRAGVGIGSGWAAYHSAMAGQLAGLLLDYQKEKLPQAAMIAQLGAWGLQNNQGVSAEQAQPVYLRDKVAKKESER